jgi:hypothetical protein
MKVKLLKKVKKRFKIMHMPKGVILFDEHLEGNLYVLIDEEHCWRGSGVYVEIKKPEEDLKTGFDKAFYTENEAIDYLKSRMIERLKREGYGTSKKNIVRKSYKQIWP